MEAWPRYERLTAAINQRRRGALAAIYRHISKNLKAASATTSPNFSDDLTDLKYNHKGVFVISWDYVTVAWLRWAGSMLDSSFRTANVA